MLVSSLGFHMHEPLLGLLYQYSWVFLVAQLVKNPPAMQETLVRFLGREGPLEK